MPPLWTLDDMARAMGAEGQSVSAAHITGLSIDTRTLAPGDAFFAIQGENRDGHAFVADALKAGAAVCVVAKQKSAEMPMGAPLLMVDDVLEALRALARAARARSNAQIVAVTGSVGKTGTKEALRIALGKQGETHASTASFNNHWGVPLSLARMPAAAKYGVFEIGMNHAGEIMPLTRLVRPHVAIVTTIAPVHLEFFESVEKIADAKAEILIGLEPIGTAILNRDNEYFDRLKAHAEQHGIKRIVSFGEHEDSDARLIKIALLPDCSTVHASILGTEVTYRIGAPGRHLARNSLAVLAAASVLGCDLALAALALSDFHAVIGRGARVELSFASGRAVLIDESYNANPASMRAALDLLGAAERGLRGRRIAVLGDMLELGPRGPDLHRALVDAIVANDIDLVYCAGPLMQELWRALPISRRALYAKSAAELESSVVAAIAPGDAVMVKGSLGSRMTPIVNALIRHYATPDAAQ